MDDPVFFTSSHYFSPSFFLTLSLLIWSCHGRQTGRPVDVWQLISRRVEAERCDGGGGWGRRGDYNGSGDSGGGQDSVVARRACVKAFSKIIHSAVATHFRLPAPITAVSSEGDRAAGRHVA